MTFAIWAAVAAAATAALSAVGRAGFVFVPLFLFVGFGGGRNVNAYLGALAGAAVVGVALGAPVAAVGGFGVAATLYGVVRLRQRR